jgi:polyferredoxin
MNINTKKLAKTTIPFFLIIFPFVFSFLIEETFENAVQLSIMAVLIIFILFAIIFKRSFCGFLCMVGALQRGVGYIGFKLLKKRVTVPATLDKYLRAAKYIILTGFAALSIASGKFLLQVSVDDVFEQYSIILPGLAWISSMLIFVTIIGSFFIDYFFCKYICIQGAVAGVAGRFSPSGIVRCEDKCINCKLCTKKCPANLEVHKMKKVISAECFNCQNCIVVCPKKGALTNSFAGRKIPLVLFVAMAGMIYILLTFLIPLFL